MATPSLDSQAEQLLVAIPTPRLDPRTDAEITDSLRTHIPVKSERNVWAFWDSGLDNLHPWCHRNILGWVRRLGPSWTVRLLDNVPGSANHLHTFVGPENFPNTFNEGTLSGRYKAQHASDFMRLAVIYHFGGVYMDVSIILFRTLDEICWTPIEDPHSPYEVAGLAYQCRTHFGQMINSFIASNKHNPFIKRWHDIFLQMWKDRTDVDGIHKHPLIRHLGLLTPYDPCFGENPNFEEYTDYCAQFLAYERLRLLREPGDDGFDGSKYFREHFFLLQSWEEGFRYDDVADGKTQFELLSLERRPEDTADPRQQQAQAFVLNLLGRSAMVKFGQGYWQPGMPPAVTKFWAQPQFADYDHKPGTWGELMRYGSVHLEQKRSYGKCLTPIAIPEEKDIVITAGYLEAV